MQKLLLSGHAVETVKSLRAHGLSHGLLPLLDVILEQPLGQQFIELALAQHRRARARGQAACRRRSCSRRCCGTRCSRTWNAAKATGEKPMPGAVRRDGPRCSGSRRSARDPAPVRGDDQGDLVAAAALRAARRRSGRSGCSSTRASAPAWDFLDLRCEERRGRPAGARRLVDALPGCRRTRSARRCCKPDEGPKKRRRSRGRGRKRATKAPRRRRPATAGASERRTGAERRRSRSSGWAATSPTRAGSSRAPCARSPGCPRTRVVARVAQLCHRAGRLRRRRSPTT